MLSILNAYLGCLLVCVRVAQFTPPVLNLFSICFYFLYCKACTLQYGLFCRNFVSSFSLRRTTFLFLK